MSPFSVYDTICRNGVFDPTACLEALLSKDDYPQGLRAVLVASFRAWMLAPLAHQFITQEMLAATTRQVERLETPDRIDRAIGIGVDSRAMFSATRRAAGNWIYQLYEQLGGDTRVRHLAFETSHRPSVVEEGRKALWVARIMNVLHYHAVHLSPLGREFGPPSIGRARKVVAAKFSKEVQKDSLHRSYWLPRKRAASWLYAASTIPIAEEPILDMLASGRIGPWLSSSLPTIAGRARYVEESLMSQLARQSDFEPSLKFSDDVRPLEFLPTASAVTENLQDLLRDGRIKKA